MRRSSWLAAAGAIVALALSESASAHGGFPRAFQILVDPGNPSDVVLRSDLWGLFHTTDGGKSWQWVCAEVYGSNSLSVDHRNIAMAPGGRTFVANNFKGLRVTDDFCGWRETADLAGELVQDVTVTATGVFVLTSTYRDGGIAGEVWRSTDNGDHFAATGASLPGTFAGSALAFAPSAPERLYVAGRVLGQSGGMLEVSSDGGATWKGFPIPISADLADVRIAGIHPARPDALFLRIDQIEGYGENQPDQILETEDAGQSWHLVYAGSGDLPGFAFSPDGADLLVAGPVDGVQRAPLDSWIDTGQNVFVQEFSRQAWGLHYTDAGLFAGMDNFTARGIPAFTYGVSKNGGQDFSELMSICDVKYSACSAGTSLRAACDAVWDNPVGGFLQDFIQGPRCVATDPGSSTTTGGGAPGSSPQADAGASNPPSNGAKRDLHIATGCDVGAARSRSGAPWSVIAALGLLARGLRARRARRA